MNEHDTIFHLPPNKLLAMSDLADCLFARAMTADELDATKNALVREIECRWHARAREIDQTVEHGEGFDHGA